jgi:hypothetical protein
VQKQNVVPMDRVERLWSKADKARATGMDAYLDFCQALAELNAAGITQEEIGKRYGMVRVTVAHCIAIGRDERIVANRYNMPKAERTLYLLTTLDDNDFQRFAKPETVEHDIRDFKASKRQPKQSKEPPFKVGAFELIHERFGVRVGNGRTQRTCKERIKKDFGIEVPSHFKDKEEAEKFLATVAPMFANEPHARPKLSESAEQKLQRAQAIEMKRLQDSFYDEVHKEVVKRIPNVRAQWERDMAEAREEAARYAKLCSGIVKKITADEFKFLLNLLHPDRQPEDRRERFARGFNIVMRLKDYAEA